MSNQLVHDWADMLFTTTRAAACYSTAVSYTARAVLTDWTTSSSSKLSTSHTVQCTYRLTAARSIPASTYGLLMPSSWFAMHCEPKLQVIRTEPKMTRKLRCESGYFKHCKGRGVRIFLTSPWPTKKRSTVGIGTSPVCVNLDYNGVVIDTPLHRSANLTIKPNLNASLVWLIGTNSVLTPIRRRRRRRILLNTTNS